MNSLLGGHALAKALKAHGVEYVFGLPGSHILSIYDGLIDEPGITSIVTRHEQGAAFAADAYARVARKPGVVLVTAGPGLLNAMTGMLEAYNSSSPILLICGEISSKHLGREWGALHELKNQLGILESVTKWRKIVTATADIPAAVYQAFQELYRSYPKPVALSIPCDVLDAYASVEIQGRLREMERALADNMVITHLVDILLDAATPLLLAGWGAVWSDAGDEIRELSEILQCPIITTERGRGIVSDGHPNVLGNIMQGAPLMDVLQHADVIFALGTRFDEESTFQWRFKVPEECSLIQIDINRNEIGKIYPIKTGLAKDVRTVLRQVLGEIGKREITPGPDRTFEFEGVRNKIRRGHSGGKGRAYVEAMADSIPDDAIVVSDTALISAWAGKYLPARKPRSFLRPDGSSTMGFALPAAIGAKIAAPQRDVVALCGDGGFMFSSAELATAVQNGIKITVVLFNDGGYGSIRYMQDEYFGRRTMADLVNPDFGKLAESFGIRGVRTHSPEGLCSALASALESDSLSFIEVADELDYPSRVEFASGPTHELC